MTKKFTEDGVSVISRNSDLIKEAYQSIVMGKTTVYTERDWNEAQDIQNALRQEMYRAMVHSGVLDHVPNITVGLDSSQKRTGIISVPSPLAISNTQLNRVDFGVSTVLVDGNKIFVGKDTSLNLIFLPEPPTFGTRDDLVFLEVWKEEVTYNAPNGTSGNTGGTQNSSFEDTRVTVLNKDQSSRIALKWRIRTVAGVNFADTINSEGLATVSATKLPVARPQGGLTTPSNDANWTYWFRKADQPYNSATQPKLEDAGLYIAGIGDKASKDLLKTYDGYVYAIPLFRVKRRNSGGFREDNLNGSRDYVSSSFTAVGTTANFEPNTTRQHTVVSTVYSSLQVGDILGSSTTDSRYNVQVISKDGNNTVTLKHLGSYAHSSTFNSSSKIPVEHRPDGKYSNVIDKDDIIDLRHKVSLTGEDYEYLRQKAFDQYMRGELVNSETVKERLGLTPAPLGLQSQLMPVKVKGNDGVERDITNLLGQNGEMNTAIAGANSSVAVATESGRTFNKYTATIASEYGYSQNFNLDSTKNYLLLAKVKRFSGNTTTANAKIAKTDYTSLKLKQFPVPTTDFGYVYMKITSAELQGQTTVKLMITGSGSTSVGDVIGVDDVSLVEIDQATYDKIDVDPEFTGDKLAQKFPYVPSYLNTITNVFNKNESPFTKSPNVTMSVTNETVLLGSASANTWNHVIYKLFLKPNTKYRLTGKTAKLAGTSPAIGTINILADEGLTTIASTGVGDIDRTFTSPANGVIRLYFYATGEVAENGSSSYTNIQVQEESLFVSKYVPFGTWVMNNDYVDGQTPTRLVDVVKHNHRRTFSDAQTSEIVYEIIDPTKTPQKHITVTQATAGQWSVGDTIKIKSDNGVLTGAIDSDTALAKIVSVSADLLTITVDDVSKLAINDTINLMQPDMVVAWSNKTITSIDTVNKTVTLNTAVGSSASSVLVGGHIIETTASTSSPAVSVPSGVYNNFTGTWSGMGTKELTYTINVVSLVSGQTHSSIKVAYAVNYPAGKGITYLPDTVLEANVNGEKLVKATDNIVRIKANYEGKVAGNTDLIPHIAKRSSSTPSANTLFEPTNAGFIELQNGSELATAYNSLSKLDGQLALISNKVVGGISQHLFAFNIIRLLEDKLGEQFFSECLTLADKVAKAKTTIAKLTANWFGWGTNKHATPIGKADFTGKVAGSIVENPHTSGAATATTLIAPTGSWVERPTDRYQRISSLGDDAVGYDNTTSTTNGAIAQLRYSFNLIEYVQRKYSFTIPGATTADKVAWLKANISKVTCNWYGYGSSVGGNKASLAVWSPTNLAWSAQGTYTLGTVGKLSAFSGAVNTPINGMTDGFVHFLAYAEPSDGVTASVINTDFVELEFELVGIDKANLAYWNAQSSVYGTASNHTNDTVSKLVMSSTNMSAYIDSNGMSHFLAYAEPSNGLSSSTINTDYIELELELNVAETGYEVFVPENPLPVLVDNPSRFTAGENMIPPFTDPRWTIHANAKVLSPYELELNATALDQHSAFSVPVLPNTTYVLSGTTEGERYEAYGYTSSGAVTAISKSAKGHVAGVNDSMVMRTTSDTAYIHVRATNRNSATGRSVYKLPMLTVGDKAKPFVPYNKNVKRKRKMDFLGKMAGSTFENPHRWVTKPSTSFVSPVTDTNLTEYSTPSYNNIAKADGTLMANSATTAGAYRQDIFEFDLSHLGLSLAELKSALRKLSIKWAGYGKGDNAGAIGYGAKIKIWDSVGKVWADWGVNSSSSPTTTSLTANSDIVDWMKKFGGDANQKVYILVHSTYPAGTASPSEIYTDYVSLEVELADYVDYVKANPVKVRKETKELKLQYPKVSYRRGEEDVIELFYQHKSVPAQISGTQEVTILAESDGFLVSDLGSSVGHKQGTHQYQNPLYRVGNDKMDTFGEFGFGKTSFAMDSKGANMGSSVVLVSSGFIDGYTTQYGLSVIKKPLVGVVNFLVLHEGELKLLIISNYTSNGTQLQVGGISTGVALLVPITGRPLTKEQKGQKRTGNVLAFPWKTPSGEIEGYLNDKGEIVPVYQ